MCLVLDGFIGLVINLLRVDFEFDSVFCLLVFCFRLLCLLLVFDGSCFVIWFVMVLGLSRARESVVFAYVVGGGVGLWWN